MFACCTTALDAAQKESYELGYDFLALKGDKETESH